MGGLSRRVGFDRRGRAVILASLINRRGRVVARVARHDGGTWRHRGEVVVGGGMEFKGIRSATVGLALDPAGNAAVAAGGPSAWAVATLAASGGSWRRTRLLGNRARVWSVAVLGSDVLVAGASCHSTGDAFVGNPPKAGVVRVAVRRSGAWRTATIRSDGLGPCLPATALTADRALVAWGSFTARHLQAPRRLFAARWPHGAARPVVGPLGPAAGFPTLWALGAVSVSDGDLLGWSFSAPNDVNSQFRGVAHRVPFSRSAPTARVSWSEATTRRGCSSRAGRPARPSRP